MDVTLKNILDRLRQVKDSGEGYSALCPAHEDRENSLSIGLGDEQQILLKCFAGCATNKVISTLGLDLGDLFDSHRIKKGSGGSVVATYEYVDCSGRAVFQVVRHSGKRFVQRRRADNGAWIYNLDGVERVLYRLSGLWAADRGLHVHSV